MSFRWLHIRHVQTIPEQLPWSGGRRTETVDVALWGSFFRSRCFVFCVCFVFFGGELGPAISHSCQQPLLPRAGLLSPVQLLAGVRTTWVSKGCRFGSYRRSGTTGRACRCREKANHSGHDTGTDSSAFRASAVSECGPSKGPFSTSVSGSQLSLGLCSQPFAQSGVTVLVSLQGNFS